MYCLFSGCEVDGPVASYVWIDSFDLNVSSGQGTASERITEGWFYANGEFLGAYSLPHEVPVIAEGLTEIQVFPGIKVNGIISTPNIYPFFARYEVDVDLEPERTDTIRPETNYLSSVKFAYLEDFETGNSFVDDIDGDLATKVEPITARCPGRMGQIADAQLSRDRMSSGQICHLHFGLGLPDRCVCCITAETDKFSARAPTRICDAIGRPNLS